MVRFFTLKSLSKGYPKEEKAKTVLSKGAFLLIFWEHVSKTEENLKAAFAGESQANRRYLYFASKADVEGQNDVAAIFRSTAEGETGHAHGHLEYLEEVGDPATGLPIGASRDNLKAAVAGETHEYTDMYPGMAKTARDEGFEEIADWFETLAKAERSHANRFQKALDALVD